MILINPHSVPHSCTYTVSTQHIDSAKPPYKPQLSPQCTCTHNDLSYHIPPVHLHPLTHSDFTCTHSDFSYSPPPPPPPPPPTHTHTHSDFSWSPRDYNLAYWVPEHGQIPAKIIVLEMPSRNELSTKSRHLVSEVHVRTQM